MDNRLLGRTGVTVSSLCLGTMMFGPWGNEDRADSIRIMQLPENQRKLDVVEGSRSSPMRSA